MEEVATATNGHRLVVCISKSGSKGSNPSCAHRFRTSPSACAIASMAEGGLDVDKLVSDLIRVVEIDRRLNELERRLAAAPSGK